MNHSRFSFPRFASILLMLMAWGIASNRCALATWALETESSRAVEIHKCCAASTAPGEEEAPGKPSGECCQALGVLPSELNANVVKAPNTIEVFELTRTWLTELAATIERVDVEEAIGPPQTRSFAEVVLQQSLLSHAPPGVA